MSILFFSNSLIILHYNYNSLRHMLHPITKWAQRKDKIFIQVALRDISNELIELTNTHLTFAGISDKQKYEFSFDFYGEINRQASKWTKTGFHLIFIIQKNDKKAPFWPRLLKTQAKNQYIQVDWSKWVDEDEQQEHASKGLGDFDPSQMQNFGDLGQKYEDQQGEQGGPHGLHEPQKKEQHVHGQHCNH